MASNTAPNYTRNGAFGSVTVTAPNTSSTGSGTIATDIFKAFTAGADGSFIDRVDFIPTASAPFTSTATVGRVFLSSITAGATTSANTFLIGEVVLPSVNADNATGANSAYSIPVGFRIPAGYTILVTNHAAAATVWRANVIAGDY